MSEENTVMPTTPPVPTGPSQEQLAAAAQAADELKARQKADREAQKAAEKAQKDAARMADKAAREEKRQADKAAKLGAKQAAIAAKEANKMPEQNGVRRPKSGGLCAQAWDVFDEVSAKNGAPASISESMPIARGRNLNEANVRAEYARWRKFNGVIGRVYPPAPPATQVEQPQA